MEQELLPLFYFLFITYDAPRIMRQYTLRNENLRDIDLLPTGLAQATGWLGTDFRCNCLLLVTCYYGSIPRSG